MAICLVGCMSAANCTRQLLESALKQLVRFLSHFHRKIMLAVGMDDFQMVFVAVELEDRAGGGGDAVDAVVPEVAVFQRSDDQDPAWSESPDHLVEVEG